MLQIKIEMKQMQMLTYMWKNWSQSHITYLEDASLKEADRTLHHETTWSEHRISDCNQGSAVGLKQIRLLDERAVHLHVSRLQKR